MAPVPTPPAPDLLSLVLELQPQAEYALVEHVGRATHALALRAIQLLDPALAEQLHSGNGLKPFTTSALVGIGHRAVTPDKCGYVRFTALNGRVVQAFQAAAGPGGVWAPDEVLELAGTRWRIQAVHQTPAAHPWAVATTYEALSSPWLLGRHVPDRRVTLRFATPTTFKSAETAIHLPVPLPALVWNSLLGKWNAFAPVALPDEVRRFADECLALGRYELRSRIVPLKAGGLRSGAVGVAEYMALNPDRFWLSTIQLLADYARFAGVGAGTSMGLGQTRRC